MLPISAGCTCRTSIVSIAYMTGAGDCRIPLPTIGLCSFPILLSSRPMWRNGILISVCSLPSTVVRRPSDSYKRQVCLIWTCRTDCSMPYGRWTVDRYSRLSPSLRKCFVSSRIMSRQNAIWPVPIISKRISSEPVPYMKNCISHILRNRLMP